MLVGKSRARDNTRQDFVAVDRVGNEVRDGFARVDWRGAQGTSWLGCARYGQTKKRQGRLRVSTKGTAT